MSTNDDGVKAAFEDQYAREDPDVQRADVRAETMTYCY